jgi:pantetheine-phosphate adenylyltransferase
LAISKSKHGRFAVVAVGGTFDFFHKGHKALITKSFEAGDRVIIGVTSNAFAATLGKKIDQSYQKRVRALQEFLQTNFTNGDYEIHKLDDYFGPAVINGTVKAIVVTEETLPRVKIANELREKRGLQPLETVLIDFVVADDGRPISSTRIRKGETDNEGRALRKDDDM